MNVQLKEILRDSEIRQVRKQLAKLATRARRKGSPLTERQKTDLLRQLVADKLSEKAQQKGAV